MKVVVLAGGFGTRLSEETDIRPKPMVEIGSKPILWHIMKIYSHYGFNDFVILLGYKGYFIKEFFSNFFLYNCDVEMDLATNSIKVLNNLSENWKVTLLETGSNTMTGGRIKRAAEHLKNERFMLTYGDGVANIDINKLLDFHINHKKKLTMTSIQPEGRFGLVEFGESNCVERFYEKPQGDGGWINGGFFVCEPEVLSYIENDQTIFERKPLEKLAEEGNIMAYKHTGFWKCMDTLRDKIVLNELWESKNAPWKIW